MSKSIHVLSPAKLNLFLHIIGKRADGYHNLQTVFRLIDFYDTLIFKPTKQILYNTSCPVILKNSQSITINPEENLIIKASRALLNYVQQQMSSEKIQQLPCIHIELQKNIPMGAGLGGGSSNCATTLITLNQLWKLNLTSKELQTIGTTLGADVPIFIYAQDAIAEGIGEILTPIALPKQHFLLLTPNSHISTAKLFSHINLRRNYSSYSHHQLKKQSNEFLFNLSTNFCNVFQPIVRNLSKEVDNALNYLEDLSTFTQTTPRMTGSGSSVFLPLPINQRLSDTMLQQWQNQAPCPTYLVNSI